MQIATLLISMSLPMGAALGLQAAAANPAPADNLSEYISCRFGNGTTVEETRERSQPFLRSVGKGAEQKAVKIIHAFNLHIAYDGTPFVNFMAERLAESTFENDKKTLIADLSNVAAQTPDAEPMPPKKETLNGFEIYSLNRTQLTGGVLSIYLFFRDIDQTVVTLYFLNTPRENPKFQSLEQEHKLRDEFIQNYASCALKNLVH